ncbi:MAG: alpha-mannosidase [Kiritimatiellia bacterium]|jgi:alpha-mannosidase
MSHFHLNLHEDRIAEVLKRLPHEILLEHIPFDAVCAVTPEPVPYSIRESLAYAPIAEGGRWGDVWDCGWFRLTAKVPKSWKGSYVVARLDFGGEALVYDENGDPKVGLTNGSVFDGHYHKDIAHLIPCCKGGEAVDLWVETGANALFGADIVADPAWLDDPSKMHGTYDGSVRACRLCRFDHGKWQLWLDLSVLFDLAKALPDTSARRYSLVRGMGKALDKLPGEGAAACRAALKPLFDVKSDPAAPDVWGVGHAHIDTAWLWPMRETVRKCARTFSSQIGLIERYPGYVFGASQAQHYAFAKHCYPGLYEKIQKAVADGSWEIQGGMWVEADCNLIGGESMVRQFLHGKNFFRDEFGVDVKNLWLPDVFGYSANLPQILRKAGMDFFLTQKLSWNVYNKMPHNTFFWRGIDGSEVLAHFPPEDDYNSCALPSQLRRHETNNRERGLVQDTLCLFGIGNGGGGPKEEHVERALRMRDLNGVPRFHLGKAQPILEKMAALGDELDTWNGELYFELHRGTLTTQAAIKRWNRRAEEALRSAEMLCASVRPQDYPIDVFDRLWKTVLVNQFHDILPGSSIHRVYVEAEAQLRKVVDEARELRGAAARKLLAADAGSTTFFNPSSTPFAGAVALPEGWKGATCATSGKALPSQDEGGETTAWIEVPPHSFATLRKGRPARAAAAKAKPEEGERFVLENDVVRYAFDDRLQLVAAFDKLAGRDILAAGETGNRLELFEDHPHCYDAWDIDEYYRSMRLDTAHVVSVQAIGTPAVRTGLEAEIRIGGSTLRQRIWLGRDGRRLDFATEADWKESHRLLRVAFPVSVEAPEASFEIQYGIVRRATHDNTMWQYAQFEGVGHRFADLSCRTYGVALLNDSKYGYRVKGHELSLSLLRSPTSPDPVADKGDHHRFTYSLLPHPGDLADSDVFANAAVINQGVERFDGLAPKKTTRLPVSLEGEGIELAVLKRAEKTDDLVVRLVETRGTGATGLLRTANARAAVTPVDLMEWNDLGAATQGKVALAFTPFEIKTFRITLPAARR